LVGILTAFHMHLAKIRKNLEHNYRDSYYPFGLNCNTSSSEAFLIYGSHSG